jgi:hypothetical protein
VLNEPPGIACDFVVATKRLTLGDVEDGGVPGYETLGFDLDGKCTGRGEGPSCIEPRWATADHTDGVDGKDNAAGRIYYAQRQSDAGSATVTANSTTESGFVTVVLRVRHYNCAKADDQVEVAVFGAALKASSSSPGPPKWDGNDEWLAYDAWLDDDDSGTAPDGGLTVENAKYVDRRAYVNDGYLVAQFDELLTGVGTPRRVQLSARIVSENGAFSLRDGTVGAREPADDVLAFLQFTPDRQTGNYLCTNSPGYAAAKKNLCSYVDIAANGTDDGSSPCDAISIGWTFDAEPAKLPGVAPFSWSVISHPNCDSSISPANDTCSNL